MERKEMIEELIERVDGELCELTNTQLSYLLAEFEHAPLITGLLEGCDISELDEDEDEEVGIEEEDELTLIDGEWNAD